MAKRLQKIVLAACRVCIKANVGCILVSGKHQGCKDAQPDVCQAIHHSLLLPKERKFYGLAKVLKHENNFSGAVFLPAEISA